MEPDVRQGDLASFIASAPGAVAMFDREMRYLAVSRQYASAYGLTGALIGRSHYEVFPEIPEAWRAVHARCLAGAQEARHEEPFPRADGRIDHVTWEMRPWHDAHGQIGGVVLTSEVVSEIVERRDALVERERRLQRLFDRMPIGIAELARETGRFLRVNAKLCEIVGWNRDELVDMSWCELASCEERNPCLAFLRPGEEPSVRELRLLSRTGVPRWVRVTFSSNTESTERIAMSAEDVTELVHAREALIRSEARQREVLDSLPSGIVLASNDLIVEANDRIAEILQLPKELLLGRSFESLTHPDDREPTRALIGKARAGTTQELEKRYLRTDGSEVWSHTRVTPLRSSAGLLLATIDDITERRAQRVAMERAEELIRRNEAQLRAVFDALPIPMGLARADGTILSFNAKFTETFGYTLEDLPTIDALQDREYLDPEERARARRRIAALQAGVAQTSSDIHIVHCKHGAIREAEVLARRVGDLIIGVYHDVTEIRRATAALLESQEWQRQALATAELATWRINFTDRTVELDARAQTLFALSRPRVSLREFLGRVHPDDILDAAELKKACVRGSYRHTQRLMIPGADVRWVAYDAVIRTEGPDHRPLNATVIGQDITQRRRATEELRASEERYRSLVDNLADVVFRIDLRGQITFVNNAAASFGYTPAQLIGRSFLELISPEDRPKALARQQAMLDGEPGGMGEYRLFDAAGHLRHTRVTTQRVDGGLVGIIVDLTETRNTEAQLRAAQKLEAIGRLAGGVAHDFNNLLTVIMSYADLGQQSLHVEDPLHGDIQQIIDAATRASTLTRRLLAFSRKQVLSPQATEIHALVDSLGKMLARLIGEDIELAITTAEGSTIAMVDPGQIEQVVMNLTINSRDAMPDGGRLEIATSRVVLEGDAAAHLEIEPGTYVRLVVRDTGCGMDAQTAARIFEPFFTTKAVGKGTGLGLSMVYGIVKQSRGGIDVETQLGAGTTFSIYLPAVDGAAVVPEVARERASRGRETILLVEDEPPVRAVAERVLLAAGYTVLSASTPGEALQIAAKCGDQIELVFSDVIMPEMNGRELTNRVRAFAPRAKVLFTSGYTDDALARSGVLAEEFLPKPYDPVLLAARIRTLLDRRA